MAPNAFSAVLWLIAAVAAALAIYAWGKRSHPAAASLALMMACIAVWLFSYGCELASTEEASMVFWLRVEYPGVALLPSAYLMFVYQYAGSRYGLSRLGLAILLIFPALTVASMWTNDLHHLYYTRIQAIVSHGLHQLDLTPGPFYWITLMYAYTCMLLGTVILARSMYSAPPRFRGPARLLLLGSIAPLVAAVARAVGFRPFGVMDISTFGLGITTASALLLILRHRFLEISPLARDLVVDGLDHGLLVVDPSGQVLDANPSVLRTLSWDPPVMGQSARQILDRWPGLRELCGGETSGSADVSMTVDGDDRTFEVHVSPVADSSGAIIARTLVWRDVTEARRAVVALRAQERMLRAQAEATHALLVSDDPDVGVMQALDAVGRLLKVDRAYVFEDHTDPASGAVYTSQRYEWTAPGVRAYLDDPTLQNVPYVPDFARWHDAFRQGRCILGHIREFPDGEREFLAAQDIVSILVAPIMVDRKPWGFLGFDDCRAERAWTDADASSLKLLAAAVGSAILRGRALAELQSMNATLNERVAERTMDLENANRELEAFATAVSNELRAPVRWIEGFSRALEAGCRDALDEEGVRLLDHIRGAARQLDMRLDGLLRLTRVGRRQISLVNVSISDLARDIVEAQRQKEPDRAVNVRIEPNLRVRACPTLMRIALSDLIENAWKFTVHEPVGFIEIGSATVASSSGVPVNAIYIRDNGVGFDPAYAHKLFGAFQRLHSESEFPGTGMGLAVVQYIIHRHGGDIWAEGSPGGGATFYFTLPSAVPAAEGGADEPPEDS